MKWSELRKAGDQSIYNKSACILMERFREYGWINFWFRYKIKIYGTFQNHRTHCETFLSYLALYMRGMGGNNSFFVFWNDLKKWKLKSIFFLYIFSLDVVSFCRFLLFLNFLLLPLIVNAGSSINQSIVFTTNYWKF